MRVSRIAGVVWLAAALSVAGCGGSSDPSGPGGRNPDLSDARPYDAGSPYAADLIGCVDVTVEPRSCSVGRLPPIAWRAPEPSVETVLERVVISHDWMGARFEEILRRLPADLLAVLGAATAIVIDDDVRPSFYWSLTGAIYVDARHLWLTPEEEATVTDRQDYRSGFGSDLAFRPFSGYLEGGVPAIPASAGPTRDLEGRVRALGALLFHEGAHANDFMPPDRLDSIDGTEPFEEATARLEGARLSRRLANANRLASGVWLGLARVLYGGEQASPSQRELSAADAGQEFAPDGASDPYAYSSQQEDLAMLFEETMLKLHFDFDRWVGFASVPSEPGAECRDYVVGWGTDGRIGAPSVAPRARLVAELVLGDSLDDFFASLDPPTPLTPGANLCIEAPVSPASVFRWM